MPKFIIKLSQFSHQEDVIPFSFEGKEPGFEDFYKNLLGAEACHLDSIELSARGDVQRLTDEYFLISADVKFEFPKACGSCGELQLIGVTESYQRSASFNSKSDEDYLIRNKEINLLEPTAEALALAMPDNIRCQECWGEQTNSNQETETSCIYSEDLSSSSPFAAALGSLSLSEKNFKN